jgi:hypothetical protein
MTDFVAEATRASEQYLEVLSKVHDMFVDAIAQVVKSVPAAPTVPTTLAMPGPTASELAQITFDFAEKALAQQKALAENLIAATRAA